MKYNYSVDENNQLLFGLPEKNKFVAARGEFRIDKDNQLVYWLNEPYGWRRKYGFPKRIVFEGSWHLNENYDFELALDKTKSQFQGDTLTIKGEIFSTGRDILAFEIKTYDQGGLLHIQMLQLSVTWLADEANRLSFIVKKRPPDILTLEGDWQINRNQQITYTYEKTELKTKTKVSKVLSFEGYWQINSSNKLTYILTNSRDSKFDFRAAIESSNIYPQEGVIKYRLGAGIKQAGPVKEKIISLYGVWKFGRKLGLSFQMDYGSGDILGVEFNADIDFDKRNEVVFALKNKKEEPLGFSVIFTHKFLKSLDAEAFLRLKESYRERGVDFGVRIPF